MKEKLTLTIEKETKERAKKHARHMGKSVSEIVEEYLNEISSSQTWTPPEDSEVSRLRSICTPKIDPFDYKVEKEKILMERYGKA